MSNFGIQNLRCVNPYEIAFREARSAVGAAEVLANATEYASLAAAVADCTLVVGTTAVGHRELQHPLRLLEDAAPRIHSELRRNAEEDGRVALVFGSEKFGLSNENLSHCHWLLHIPMSEEHFSMNLGQAVAVCLYELVRGAKETPAIAAPQPATAGQLERLTAMMLQALHSSGYAHAYLAEDTEEDVRRMMLRLNVCSGDVESLLGMLRKMLWKMQTKN